MHTFEDLPPSAAWYHVNSRTGFEVAFFGRTAQGWKCSGHTTAIERAAAWCVRYEISVDAQWRTRAASVWCWNGLDASKVSLLHDGAGQWTVDGRYAADLDGCVDVDLESSACTNALPVHRMAADRSTFHAPAAYVRVAGGAVQRLEQAYSPIAPLPTAADDEHRRFRYLAPEFDFECELAYDRHGLVLDYPGIARRAH